MASHESGFLQYENTDICDHQRGLRRLSISPRLKKSAICGQALGMVTRGRHGGFYLWNVWSVGSGVRFTGRGLIATDSV